MTFEDLGKRLKAVRELAGLSQYEFARLSGISRGRISLVECGDSELTEDEHCRAERVLRAGLADRYKLQVHHRAQPESLVSADGKSEGQW